MGALGSKAYRFLNRFNIENRAHRVLADPRPRPAPKHEKTIKEIESLDKEMPHMKEELMKFNESLHDRLKQVYVSSTDVLPPQKTSKKLPPLSHKVRRTSDFGFDESEGGTEGHILLRDVVNMLMKYSKQDDVSVDDLAKSYKLKREDAANIIKYYQCFSLRLQDSSVDQEKFLKNFLFGQSDGRILSSNEFVGNITPFPQKLDKKDTDSPFKKIASYLDSPDKEKESEGKK